MSQPKPKSVNELLVKWKAGDQEALNALVPLIYNELHALAHHYLRGERSGHTLQTTALVHEAYMRLAKQGPFQTQNREHFVAVAARLMRQILVDYARSHRAAKRGAECTIELADDVEQPQQRSTDVVALDDALNALAKLDANQARIVELRFFGGLTLEETGGVLGVSAATIGRDWSMAKAWLHREMQRSDDGKKRSMDKD
ncbi:MAG TPA: sigma-70 family RNA polymerase sigma factor [Alphaproteobacteria bacterium]|nr:sigma-70 family RNA polymerase sigma factor [Alphaproteobacteria bacterium]